MAAWWVGGKAPQPLASPSALLSASEPARSADAPESPQRWLHPSLPAHSPTQRRRKELLNFHNGQANGQHRGKSEPPWLPAPQVHPHAFLHLQEPRSNKGCAFIVFKLSFDVISPGSFTLTTPSCLECCCRVPYPFLLPPYDLLPPWPSRRKGMGCNRALAGLLATSVHPNLALTGHLCYGVQEHLPFEAHSEPGPVTVWTRG